MRRVGATSCHGLRLVITPGCAAVQTSLDKVSEFMSLLVWEGLWMDGWMVDEMMDVWVDSSNSSKYAPLIGKRI